MCFSRVRLAVLISVVLVAPSVYAAHTHRSTTSGQASTSHKLSQRHRARRVRGQQAIDPERVTQIQSALIREHYLPGPANGKWDATTIAAMQKYQADHGWQTKLMPDSRALKKLGLGPDYSNALNAKNANIDNQPAASAVPVPASQNAGFVAASGVSQ